MKKMRQFAISLQFAMRFDDGVDGQTARPVRAVHVPCRRIGPSLGRAAKSKDDRSTCRPRLYIVARFVISEQVLICYHIYLVAEYVVRGCQGHCVMVVLLAFQKRVLLEW